MPKKKSTTRTLADDREELRRATAYGSGRTGAAIVLILGGVAALVVGIFTLSAVLIISAIFSFALLAMAGALFDLADAALLDRRSDKARTGREVAAISRPKSDLAPFDQ